MQLGVVSACSKRLAHFLGMAGFVDQKPKSIAPKTLPHVSVT